MKAVHASAALDRSPPRAGPADLRHALHRAVRSGGPASGWRLGLSASSGARPDNHWVDELRVRTGTHVGDTPVPLSVSLNGQQFVDVLESLTYVFEGP